MLETLLPGGAARRKVDLAGLLGERGIIGFSLPTLAILEFVFCLILLPADGMGRCPRGDEERPTLESEETRRLSGEVLREVSVRSKGGGAGMRLIPCRLWADAFEAMFAA